MRQDDARVGEQPAPVAGMVAAFAQVDHQVHVERAARAEEHGRLAWLQARAVGGDEHVRLQEILVLGTDFPQSGGTHLLAGLDQHLEIEAQLAACLDRRRGGGKIDGVLALVVGGATAVETLAVARQLPGIESLLPALVLAPDDVAVTVREDRDEGRVLDALSEEKRPASGKRIWKQSALEPQALEAGLHFGREVALEVCGPLRVLAFGGDGDPAREVGEKSALVEVPLGMRNGVFPAHRLVDYLR